MNKLTLAIIPITALILSLASGIASAVPVQSVTATSMAFDSPTTVRIKYRQDVNDYVFAGAFNTKASDTSGSFLAWCVDIFQSTFFGKSITDFDRQTASTALLASKTDALTSLATQSLGKVNNSLTSAAFQLAIWEIANETNSVYGFTTGAFRAFDASDESIALATQWLNGLPTVSGVSAYSISILESSGYQDLAVFTEVPEPSSIAVLFAGLIGFAMTRRKFLK
ncbi:MAG: PEP-CTERM sorting domain-containing protein [Pseudomonadota bacterium]